MIAARIATASSMATAFEARRCRDAGLYLTDFHAAVLDAFSSGALWGLTVIPELRDQIFGGYEKLIYLAQTDDPALDAEAATCAEAGLRWRAAFHWLWRPVDRLLPAPADRGPQGCASFQPDRFVIGAAPNWQISSWLIRGSSRSAVLMTKGSGALSQRPR